MGHVSPASSSATSKAAAGGASSKAPVQAGGAALHAFVSQFARPPPTSALEDSMLAAAGATYKLDLLTPVISPARCGRCGEIGWSKGIDEF